MPTLSAPSWHAALTAANVAFIPDGNISKNQQELLRHAKRTRDVKQRYENPNVWADYLASLSVERDPNNKKQYTALLELYQTAVKLVPLSGSNRLSADYLGLWLGLAQLQEEVSLEEARETYKNLRYNGIGKYYPKHHDSLAAFEERCGNLERAEKHRQDSQRIRDLNEGKSRKRTTATKTSPDPSKRVEPVKEVDEKDIGVPRRTVEEPKRPEKTPEVPQKPIKERCVEDASKRGSKFVPRRVVLEKKPKSNIPSRPLSKPSNVDLRATQKRSPLANLEGEHINGLPSVVRDEKHRTPPVLRPEADREQENKAPRTRIPLPTKNVSPAPVPPSNLSPDVITPPTRASNRPRTGATRRIRETLISPRVPPKDARHTVQVNGQSYEVLSQVGKGGSSKVYKVLSHDNEVMALKRVVVSPDNHAAMESYGSEIAHLRRLKGEPTIVQLRDAEVSPKTGTILLVLELGDIDLAMLLRREKDRHIANDVLRSYWRQMLSAVTTIHEAKIVHGDLKPANFVSVSGILKLIDFGIAKAITADDTTKITRESLAGTPNYMSPEALQDIDEEEETGRRGYRVGRASDIWSLGCILYQMVYGKTPFAHIRDTMRKTLRIKDPSYEISFRHTGNSALDDVLRGCLQRDPAKRLTMDQLKAHPFLQDGPSHLNVTELVTRLKSRGYNFSLVDRITGLPLHERKALQELELCLKPTKMTTRTATRCGTASVDAHTPSVSAVTKASKVTAGSSFANSNSLHSSSAR